MGDIRHHRAILRGVILYLFGIRRQLYRRRLDAARAWQLADRHDHDERLAARARIIEQARSERAQRDGVGRAA